MSAKSIFFIVLFLIGFGTLIFQLSTSKIATITEKKVVVLPTEIHQENEPIQTYEGSIFTQTEWVEKKYAF